ncbi:phage tail sheath subtilisin-like domain-containing protein [Nocardioides sp. cx-169]|uniref:phage tail sheath subtilisin-like domain-containing protein n=1 Tax=Nocardioides sp. cx-169 TaxID=2899080 RepID=UPI001E2CD9CE|nr:phage tail sheath subtilisin-like domain-containing protein [Nocardioides sp. cx-169]MCD4536381.1 phage tail sheath subtilisin-like domain-containing protein [Nocardioides sp. cx-169]
MSTYFAPGVYVEEVPSGPQPIAPASTSVLAIIGRTRRGPSRTPTRVNGWTDFQRIFDGNAGSGFTAEAVYGFFENGGPAAYVVRADPSIAGTWTVRDGAGAEAFTVTASSPGSWAADLTVSAAPDRDSGSAQLYRARVRTTTPFSGDTVLPVDSTLGVTRGDPVLLLQANEAAAAAEATVQDVGSGTITVRRTAGGAFTLPAGSVVTGVVPAGATQVTVTGTGLKKGDVVQAELGDRSRFTWRATAAVPQGAALSFTAAAAAAGAVPGAQFTSRIARFRGTIPAGSPEDLPLGSILWLETAGLEPGLAAMTTNLRARAANGLEGRWVGGTTNALRFPQPPPAGPIEVEARLGVTVFGERREWVSPSTEQLAAAYSFVPAGTRLRLRPAAGTTGATVTRTADAPGFAVDAGDTLAATFTTVEFLLPTDASQGVLVRCARPPEVGDRVRFTSTKMAEIVEVGSIGGDVYLLGFADTTDVSTAVATTFDPGVLELRCFVSTRLYPLRFSLSVSGRAGSETFKGLALERDHPQYYARDGIINEVSQLVTVAPRAGGAAAPAETTTPALAVPATAGSDVAPTPQDYRRAIASLDIEPEPAMVCCPDLLTFDDPLAQYDLADALVRHCERFRRFAVLDAPRGDDEKVLEWRNTAVSTTYAAVFAPHLKILDLDPSSPDRYRLVPPSGFVAGVMARTDRERGVHKAPGNERVSGIVGLDQQYTQARQELLNPAGVNLIRAFPGRGSRVWGARNATDDAIWRYINVRRLFNMVEVSVERGTQWVVFEPNTATTWLRIKASLEGLLDQLWRSGALAGEVAAQAYRVRVGLGSTMSETDIDNGLVITEVAIAPSKPAEFVVFRFSHKRLSE